MAIQLTPRASLDRFKDFDLNFTAHPITGDVAMLTGEAAIKRSVKNLVLLNFYEVPFNPNIGSGVSRLLFEPYTPVTESNIEDAIFQVLDKFEPRINLLDVTAKGDPDRNNIDITLEFRIVNNPAPVTVEFVLERNN